MLAIDSVSEIPLEFFPQIKAASLDLHYFSRISIFKAKFFIFIFDCSSVSQILPCNPIGIRERKN